MPGVELKSPWEAAARHFEPPPEPEEPPDWLADPVSLACHLDPFGFVRRPHLEVIARTYQDLNTGVIDRVAISLPSQVGKSTTAAVWGVFWWLIHHPTHRVILVSYADGLAITHGRSVKKLVKRFGAQFDLHLDPSHHAAGEWELTTGGGMRSVGIGAGVTGHPADVGVADDLHKNRAESDSRTVRDAVHSAWSADIQSRLAPGAPVVGIGTRWHPDDFIGRRIREEGDERTGGRWRVLNMPALCTNPKTDPLGRKLGDPLPHPKIHVEDKAAALRHWQDKRRSATPRDWGSLWQGDPQPPEGSLLTGDELIARRCYGPDAPPLPEAQKSAVAVDPSGGGRDTAGIIGGFLGTDKRLYLTDDVTMVGPADVWAREACLLAWRIDAERIIVENNYGADMARLTVRTAWEALSREGVFNDRPKLCPQIRMVHGKKGKLLRAEPVAQQWREDHIRTATYLPDVESEWATWQADSTESPGRIDASVYLALDLLPIPGAAALVSSAAGVSRSTVGGGGGRRPLPIRRGR